MDKSKRPERRRRNINIFPNDSPFEEKELVEAEINKWIIRKNKKKPVFILLDGVQSTGKTTLAIHIIDYINKQHGLPQCDLGKEHIQLSMGGEQFIENIGKCEDAKSPVLAYDEAGDYNRKGWQSQLNKILDRILDTFRAYGIIALLITHDFTKLPPEVFDKRLCWILIHLKERDHNGRSEWHWLRNIYQIKELRKKAIFPEDAYNRIHPNIKTRFKDLSPERSRQLDELSTSSKRSMRDTLQLKLKGLLTIREMADKLNRSTAWVRAKIPQLKIKSQIYHKRIKYYNNEAYLRLIDELKR